MDKNDYLRAKAVLTALVGEGGLSDFAETLLCEANGVYSMQQLYWLNEAKFQLDVMSENGDIPESVGEGDIDFTAVADAILEDDCVWQVVNDAVDFAIKAQID